MRFQFLPTYGRCFDSQVHVTAALPPGAGPPSRKLHLGQTTPLQLTNGCRKLSEMLYGTQIDLYLDPQHHTPPGSRPWPAGPPGPNDKFVISTQEQHGLLSCKAVKHRMVVGGIIGGLIPSFRRQFGHRDVVHVCHIHHFASPGPGGAGNRYMDGTPARYDGRIDLRNLAWACQ